MSHYIAGCPHPWDQCKCDKPAADQRVPSKPERQLVCPTCPDRDRAKPVAQEIEGRVLVCDDCAADEELREHARDYW